MSDIKLDKAARHKQDVEWVMVCAEEIVKSWPNMTMRTLYKMCASVDALKDALSKVR
jgi:hypothetical protein